MVVVLISPTITPRSFTHHITNKEVCVAVRSCLWSNLYLCDGLMSTDCVCVCVCFSVCSAFITSSYSMKHYIAKVHKDMVILMCRNIRMTHPSHQNAAETMFFLTTSVSRYKSSVAQYTLKEHKVTEMAETKNKISGTCAETHNVVPA